MQKDTFLKIVIIALLLINAATLAFLFLHGRGPGRDFPPHGPGAYLEHELNMNDSQKEVFHRLRDEHHSKATQYQEQIHDLHQQLFDGLKNNQPINQNLLSQIVSKQKSLDSLTYDHFTRLKKILHPDQQEKFDHIIDEALRMMAPGPPFGR